MSYIRPVELEINLGEQFLFQGIVDEEEPRPVVMTSAMDWARDRFDRLREVRLLTVFGLDVAGNLTVRIDMPDDLEMFADLLGRRQFASRGSLVNVPLLTALALIERHVWAPVVF